MLLCISVRGTGGLPVQRSGLDHRVLTGEANDYSDVLPAALLKSKERSKLITHLTSLKNYFLAE